MKESGLIFSGPMVQAILEGRKTMTRRIVSKRNSMTSAPFEWHDLESPQTFVDDPSEGSWYLHAPVSNSPEGYDKTAIYRIFSRFAPAGEWDEEPIPEDDYIPPATRIWVRETWGIGPSRMPDFAGAVIRDRRDDWIIYRADGGAFHADQKWRASIHIPRWACRITLDITAVRVERLQEISMMDARAEGADPLDTYLGSFQSIWNSIHGEDAWETNPYVWVIEFERAKDDNGD